LLYLLLYLFHKLIQEAAPASGGFVIPQDLAGRVGDGWL
jgi:hypothetical protein